MPLGSHPRKVVDANPAACRFLGYSRERLRNLALDDLIAPDAAPSFGAMWIRALKSGGHRETLPGGSGKCVGDPATGLLTPRRVEVLTQLAHGASVEEIAESLGIARETGRVHLRNARRRLGARSRTHAITLAVQRGTITP